MITSGWRGEVFISGQGNAFKYCPHAGGAKIETREKNEGLLEAVQCSDYAAVAHFIEAGADVNCQAKARDGSLNCHSALMLAAENGHLEVTGLLLRHGADPDIVSSGRPALTQAVLCNHEAIVRLLLEHGATARAADYRYNRGIGPPILCMAVYNRNIEMVKLLLSAGCQIDARGTLFTRGTYLTGPRWGAAIDQAVWDIQDRAVDLDLVQLLLDKGAIANHRTMYFALDSSNPDPAVVRLLLDVGVRVDLRDEYFQDLFQSNSPEIQRLIGETKHVFRER